MIDLSKASQERSAAAKRENADADIETAELEFALGEIAEQEVRWQEAFAHYSDAARLQPIYTHLISAQSMALHLANYQEAETLVKSALTAAKKEYGEATPEYSTSLNNLAVLLKETGRFEEAESIYKQALENTRQTQGENHPNFAITLNNLATLLQSTGRFGAAEPLLRQALEITQQTLGEDDPVFGIRLNNLAGLLRAAKRYDEAEPLFLQAIKVFEKSLVPTHPNTINAKQNLEIFLAERPERS